MSALSCAEPRVPAQYVSVRLKALRRRPMATTGDPTRSAARVVERVRSSGRGEGIGSVFGGRLAARSARDDGRRRRRPTRRGFERRVASRVDDDSQTPDRRTTRRDGIFRWCSPGRPARAEPARHPSASPPRAERRGQNAERPRRARAARGRPRASAEVSRTSRGGTPRSRATPCRAPRRVPRPGSSPVEDEVPRNPRVSCRTKDLSRDASKVPKNALTSG